MCGGSSLFLLLWVLDACRDCARLQGSWSDGRWIPRFVLATMARTQKGSSNASWHSPGRFSPFPLLLWIKGNQSWSPPLPNCKWETGGSPVKCVAAENVLWRKFIEDGSSGWRKAVQPVWYPWRNFCENTSSLLERVSHLTSAIATPRLETVR